MNKFMMSVMAVLMLITILGVSGCATTDTLTDDEKNIAYAQYIIENELESIKHIRAFNFRGWSPLTDDYLVLSSSFKKRYLIELKNGCYDLGGSYTIALKQSMTNQLSINFDAILVLNDFQKRCYIKSIYPINKAVMKELQAIGKLKENKNHLS